MGAKLKKVQTRAKALEDQYKCLTNLNLKNKFKQE
jgi:hypothetical protein